jgi:hypothetical protein
MFHSRLNGVRPAFAAMTVIVLIASVSLLAAASPRFLSNEFPGSACCKCRMKSGVALTLGGFYRQLSCEIRNEEQ